MEGSIPREHGSTVMFDCEEDRRTDGPTDRKQGLSVKTTADDLKPNDSCLY